MTETTELQVNEEFDNGRTDDGIIITDDSKPALTKTESTQMLDAHEVEEALLKPLCFGKFIVKCPCLLCFIIMFFLIIIAIIDAGYFSLSDSHYRTFLVESSEYVIALDAYTLAGEYVGDLDDEDNSTALPQTEPQDYWVYQFLFTLKDYNGDFDENNPDKTDYWILTPENIETIIKYENMIIQDPEWKNQFCYVGDDPVSSNYSCSPSVSSIARMIYDEPAFQNGSMTTEDTKEWVEDFGYGNLAYFFNPGLNATGQTYIYRSFIYAAMPIATEWKTVNGTTVHMTEYKNAQDKYDDQESEYIEWATELFVDITVNNNAELIDGNLEIIAMTWPVYNEYGNILLGQSTGYLVFSILIVVAYMSFHLGSIFLAICALFQILMSFPLAYFLYRVIFGIEEFNPLSVLIIFVLLGVGADDVFVFTDAWLQSVYFVRGVDTETIDDPEKGCWGNDAKSCSSGCNGCCGPNETKKLIVRMSFAFRRAAKAMLVTQATTFFAFLATAASPIMFIAAFGVWAAIVVAMNYLLVISLYPAFLIFHHVYLKKWETMCLCCCCNLCGRCKNNDEPTVPKRASVGDDEKPRMMRQLTVEEQAEEYRCFEKFLGTKYSKFVSRWSKVILVIFTIFFILGAVGGFQMEAQSEEEVWFTDDHFMLLSTEKMNEFSASDTDDLVQTTITFGIEGVDRSGTTRWDPEEYGVIVWDDGFDMSSSEAQEALLTICNETKTSSLVYSADKVDCPIEEFRQYLGSINEAFPYDSSASAEGKSFEQVFYEYLESPYGSDAVNGLLSYIELTDDGEYIQRFYAMYVYTKNRWSDNSNDARDGRSDWDDWIDEFSKDCPDNVCGHVLNVGFRWCWLDSQVAFVTSAIQGILIAMPLALVILLISTQNWIISIFAVVDILGVMLCELAIMYLAGWNFGTAESIAIVIIIGFSVDYVVHIANAYLESTAETREERLSFAMLTMGISVVSGAVTTFGAGFFLVFPDLIFFYKMGIIMVSTVILSIAWAMLFFPAIVAWIGPEGDRGDVKKWFRCCPCYKGGDNEDNGTPNGGDDDDNQIEMGGQDDDL